MSNVRRRTYSSFNSMGMLSSGNYIVCISKTSNADANPKYVIYNADTDKCITISRSSITPSYNLPPTSGVEYEGVLYLNLNSSYGINVNTDDYTVGTDVSTILSYDMPNTLEVELGDNVSYRTSYGVLDPATGDRWAIIVSPSYRHLVKLDNNNKITEILLETSMSVNLELRGLYDGILYVIGNGGLYKYYLMNSTAELIADVNLCNVNDWFIA